MESDPDPDARMDYDEACAHKSLIGKQYTLEGCTTTFVCMFKTFQYAFHDMAVFSPMFSMA